MFYTNDYDNHYLSVTKKEKNIYKIPTMCQSLQQALKTTALILQQIGLGCKYHRPFYLLYFCVKSSHSKYTTAMTMPYYLSEDDLTEKRQLNHTQDI